MSLIPLRLVSAMVRKDLLLFLSDRRSVIVAFAVPIAIASFMGSIFSGSSNGAPPTRIAVKVVDEDGSAISRAIESAARGDRSLAVTSATIEEARDSVRRGKTSVALVIPRGFGEAAGAALFSDSVRPQLTMLYDPSRRMEEAIVQAVSTEYVMQAVGREMFRMPYSVRQEAVTDNASIAYNGYAHSFAGMGIQFLLFAMANLGVDMLLERQRGIWKRLRSAPVSRLTLLAGKAMAGTIIALMTLFVSFAFAMIVFRVRIQGSVAGFLAVSVACSLMAATFGLLVAALGSTPATARGVTTLAVLVMVMLGGAWAPTFIFPAWLQRVTLVIPVRWAVDGLDAMTWRGVGIGGALTPSLVLLGFAAVFGSIAASRFRWEEA